MSASTLVLILAVVAGSSANQWHKAQDVSAHADAVLPEVPETEFIEQSITDHEPFFYTVHPLLGGEALGSAVGESLSDSVGSASVLAKDFGIDPTKVGQDQALAAATIGADATDIGQESSIVSTAVADTMAHPVSAATSINDGLGGVTLTQTAEKAQADQVGEFYYTIHPVQGQEALQGFREQIGSAELEGEFGSAFTDAEDGGDIAAVADADAFGSAGGSTALVDAADIAEVADADAFGSTSGSANVLAGAEDIAAVADADALGSGVGSGVSRKQESGSVADAVGSEVGSGAFNAGEDFGDEVDADALVFGSTVTAESDEAGSVALGSSEHEAAVAIGSAEEEAQAVEDAASGSA